ncbi:MAG: corrinoid protein [Bacteroidetes bacterium]|nr:corrinoid protein [Bacteroidota bacterium]
MGIDKEFVMLADAVIAGKHIEAGDLTSKLIDESVPPGEILENGLLPGMDVVGKRFRDNQIFLPQVLISARAMKASMKILEPLMVGSGHKMKGTALLGTVKGDVHDIGKNIVSIMLQGNGYTVIDLGTDCTAEKFLSGAGQHHPDVIGLSALLTTTMVYMKTIIDFLRSQQVSIPIIVGGAPVNQKFADEIGANGTARNAAEAVELITKLMSERKEN